MTEELTDEEFRILDETSIEYPSGLDVDAVDRIVGRAVRGDDLSFLARSYGHSTPEERAAKYVLLHRKYVDEQGLSERALFLFTTKLAVTRGAKILEMNGDYHRFQPCIELIFELEPSSLEKLYEYLADFENSDYAITLEQNRQVLFDSIRDCEFEDIDAQAATDLLDTYHAALPIFERGFPNLLALKRILDGETPANEALQRKRASSVRRELTDSTQPNSVYFDLIVEKFDRKLRNGIAHGDLVNDGRREEIRIPTQNTRYSYDELVTIVTENLSNATFLTGTFRSLVQWQYATRHVDELGRADLEI